MHYLKFKDFFPLYYYYSFNTILILIWLHEFIYIINNRLDKTILTAFLVGNIHIIMNDKTKLI